MARFTMLDGAASIGGTKLLFETGDREQSTRLLFDFGLNYATMGTYFEEFLTPRMPAGLTDYLTTGLLPALQMYRSDLTTLLRQMHPEEAVRQTPMDHIAACFITHGHVDHTGLISFLDETIPLYATPVTAALLRAVEQTRYGTGPEDDITDFLIRPNLGENKHGRRLLFDLHEPVVFQDCRVTAWPVDHSIPGACAYLIEHEGGTLVYSGDLRLHGRMGHVTADTVAKLATFHPDALIIEGTNLRGSTGASTNSVFARSFTFWNERDVEAKALEETRQAGALVIADFGMKDLDRLMTFQHVAHAAGRRLAILPRDACIVRAVQEAGYSTIDLDDPDLVLYIKRSKSGIYDAKDIDRDWARAAIVRFAGYNPDAMDSTELRDATGNAVGGSCPRIVRAEDVARDQSSYLLSLGYWDIQELCDLKPRPGSLYIHSSAEAFNEEMSWSQERLARWLSLSGMDSVHIHASGHASQEDLFHIVEELSPIRIYPVHTEHAERYAECFGAARVRMPSNGETIRL